MKKLFCLLLTFTLGFIYSQEKNKTEKDSIVWVKMTCEKGIDQAKVDAEKGIYKCLSYGLIFDQNPKLNKFVKEYREKKYGIVIGNGGCVTSDYSECYSKTMKKIILEKFGADIFEKSRKEAEELYAKQ
ncbi:MAG: hypothetical protein REI96_04065 [Flavobacterium nitrogenifigens]|uniref:hypothetical protein n=1 Tax=Flavobacterium nitrogenifigens TaxID=1617283 RepID=UPI00280756B3|nr:hypothetical protein [Flavobacterium nitrogenifigens]MDQ8011599.1 hypothetical protein [Flavobacterium nitrogenifigens]